MTRSLLRCFSLVLLLSLTACSFVSIAYRNLDWLAMNRIDEYFDLTDSQEAFLEPRVKKVIQELKKDELPQLYLKIRQLVGQLKSSKPIADLGVNDLVEKVKTLAITVVSENSQDVTTFLTSLSKEQIEYFKEKLGEANDKTAKLATADPKEYREKLNDMKVERFERYEDWLGSISSEQKAIVFDAQRDQDYYKRYLSFRKDMQSKFIGLLVKLKHDPKRLESRLKRFFNNQASFANAAGKKFLDERSANWQKRMSLLKDSLTQKQRVYFAEKLDGLVTQLNAS